MTEKPGKSRPDEARDRDLAVWYRDASPQESDFSNPDTDDWIAYEFRTEDLLRSPTLDASHLVEAPSGTHGFLRRGAGDQFIFEDGTPIRFIGGQANMFAEKDLAAWHVQWLRKNGLNFVRSHGFGLPNEERWDRLDFFINECKKAGIYVVLTPIYSTKVRVVDPTGQEVEIDNQRMCFFNSNIEMALREIWKEFFLHENPYTGLRYCDDPTIAMTELKNEDSTFWALEISERIQPTFYADVLRQYSQWLGEKYDGDEVLRRAWEDEGAEVSALEDDESINSGNIRLLRMQSWWDYTSEQQKHIRQRKTDQMEFLHEKLLAFYDRSYSFLRQIGVKQAITGSNWRGKAYTWRLVTQADSRTDYIDQHDYWDHPSGGWNTKTATLHNRSMIRSDTGGLVGNLAPRSVSGMPYTVSEWNIGSWNEHTQESAFLMVAYGSLQGWDGLLHFVLNPNNLFNGISRFVGNFFDVANNPSVALQYPTLSRIWHRYDIDESEPVLIRRIAPSQWYIPKPVESALTPHAHMFAGVDIPPLKQGQLGPMAAAVGKLSVEFTDELEEHFVRDDIARYIDQEKEIARSITGQLFWDYGRGISVIDTPRTQAVCGFLGGSRIQTANAAFDIETDYCTILITTLEDDEPIGSSGRLLVTALGRSRNTGQVYGRPQEQGGNGTVAVLQEGEAPILIEPVMGTLRIKIRDPRSAKVHLLGLTGIPERQIQAKVEDDELVLPLPGEHKAVFYEITQ
ncbi:hypothetical protein ACFL6S_01470 [Candidatus Poribacteria bacterium]